MFKDYDKGLLTDYNTLTNTTYEDYIKEKGCLLFRINNIKLKDIIRKEGNVLYLNENSYNLNNKNIYEVLLLILDNLETPAIEVVDYGKDSYEYLTNISALFLQDFTNILYITRRLTHSPIDYKSIQFLETAVGNNYELYDYDTFTLGNKFIPNYVENEKIFIESDNLIGNIISQYRGTNMNINFLREFPINNIQQISEFSEVDYARYIYKKL